MTDPCSLCLHIFVDPASYLSEQNISAQMSVTPSYRHLDRTNKYNMRGVAFFWVEFGLHANFITLGQPLLGEKQVQEKREILLLIVATTICLQFPGQHMQFV